jgi:hypothetical protein
MKTIPIRYIGKKPSHTDDLYGTNITWERVGDEKQVPVNVVPFMLMHPDVYEDARSKALQKKQPIKAEPLPMARRDFDKELPMANLAYMTKAQMAQYAAKNLRLDLKPESMTVQQMRNRIMDGMMEPF